MYTPNLQDVLYRSVNTGGYVNTVFMGPFYMDASILEVMFTQYLQDHFIQIQDQVKRLLKGVYKLRPALPKYTCTWDLQVVLNFIATWMPNRELSIEKINKIFVVLLALCTAHRIQTLFLIKLENIVVDSVGVKIYYIFQM